MHYTVHRVRVAHQQNMAGQSWARALKRKDDPNPQSTVASLPAKIPRSQQANVHQQAIHRTPRALELGPKRCASKKPNKAKEIINLGRAHSQPRKANPASALFSSLGTKIVKITQQTARWRETDEAEGLTCDLYLDLIFPVPSSPAPAAAIVADHAVHPACHPTRLGRCASGGRDE